MATDVKIYLADDRNINTQAVIVKMSQKYEIIVRMSDLLTLEITVTGLPNNVDPLKNQLDNNCLKPYTPPSDTVKEIIPDFANAIMDLILVNKKVKITDWAKFRLNDGYVSLNLTKVDFTMLKYPFWNYVSWIHEAVVKEQVKKWLVDEVI
ncbi:hypothetical protein SARC_02790 [Sphaeroforma arctica JP610]|uniref:Uncharacterized protein n=1 Tax=Sphaeroforma arctica JP610 TaxID=667725 RepID=A0A0L0G7Y1_9EUKA|nr:hypothetical protein SARC_02790 [Sphaeroforma arctica JP610]KNC85001.1 hypothetical protein SARC_02790 [Sphaeroforma arctica JP610]|eukprot:XP_014158903.1 hypothetical protein SARC_02790 [Sphaeroforma arctica JP610]